MTIAQEITKRGLDFTWFASAVVNQVDKPLLKAFKAAGCWAILFGAESGVQKDLNTIRKGITPDQIRKAVKAAKEVGLTVYTPFLFGIPGQTYEDGLKTIEFALELDRHRRCDCRGCDCVGPNSKGKGQQLPHARACGCGGHLSTHCIDGSNFPGWAPGLLHKQSDAARENQRE